MTQDSALIHREAMIKAEFICNKDSISPTIINANAPKHSIHDQPLLPLLQCMRLMSWQH